MSLQRVLPVATLIVALAVLGMWMAPPSDAPESFQTHGFGKLPAVNDGRVKPLEAVAREALLRISRKQTYQEPVRDAKGEIVTNSSGDPVTVTKPAIEWLLLVMSRSPLADDLRIYRIDNPDVLTLLGLDERSDHRYSLNEFRPRIPDLGRQAMAIETKEENGEPIDLVERKTREIAGSVSTVFSLSQASIPLAVPPEDAASNDWTSLAQWNRHFMETGQTTNNAIRLTLMLASFGRGSTAATAADRAGAADSFNRTLNDYRLELAKARPSDVSHSATETWFLNAEPFYHGALLYLMAFVLLIFGFLLTGSRWARPLMTSALWLVILTAVVHTASLIMRMWLQGRPPVTNLYASAIFIGWGASVVGLFMERHYRNGMGTLVVSVMGAVTLLIAHLLSTDGQDTMEMQRAVLDTNFWLATHVTTVTLGYCATFIAGLLGIVFVIVGVFTNALDAKWVKTLGGNIYGVICFATLLSFTGTVLGGIWADQSWGRFWGWDPKENGALLIVIWNALVLHARWCGLVQQRGVATMAVFGNIVTAWSWFGVNELGVGLHSYGFTEGTRRVLMIFMLSQLVIIAIGMMPRGLWRSFALSDEQRGGVIRGTVTAALAALMAGTIFIVLRA